MVQSSFYRSRIQQALEFIDANLCDSFTAADVAKAAHFSQYHFHRLFPAYTGESIHHYVRSRRLEKAATALQNKTVHSLTQLSLEVGFETPSAFARAFKQHFGISPSQFKSGNKPLADKPMRASVNRPYLKTQTTTGLDLSVTIKSLETCYLQYRVAAGVVSGQFFVNADLSILFADLADFQPFAAVSAYPASPTQLNDDSVEVWYGGLFVDCDQTMWSQLQHKIGAGSWAVFQYQGSYQYLHQAWSQVYCVWLPNSPWLLRDELPFEMYLNSPQQVSRDDLISQIWLPVLAVE